MIPITDIQKLREETKMSIMECKNALEQSGGDFIKAKEILKQKGFSQAEGKQQKNIATNGVIDAYIHANKKIGVLINLACETDFVANNPDFQKVAHEIAMQIAAMAPQYLSREDIPQDIIQEKRIKYTEELKDSGKSVEIINKIIEGKIDKEFRELCLLEQPFIKNEEETVGNYLKNIIAKFGEKIEIKEFSRFKI